MIPWLGFERRWRDSIVAAAIPGDVEDAVGAPTPEELAAFWPELERAAPPILRFGFRLAVWLFALAAPFVLGRLRTFPALERDEQDALLTRIHAGPYLARQLVRAVVLVAAFAWGTVPRLRAGLDR